MDLPEIQQWNELKEGDVTAFEMFFKTYYQPLCNYAYSFIQDKDEAEEIVQSAFLTVWEKKDSLNIKTSLKSYLYTMVRNTSLNVIKHEKIKQKYVGEALAIEERSHEGVAQAVLTTGNFWFTLIIVCAILLLPIFNSKLKMPNCQRQLQNQLPNSIRK